MYSLYILKGKIAVISNISFNDTVNLFVNGHTGFLHTHTHTPSPPPHPHLRSYKIDFKQEKSKKEKSNCEHWVMLRTNKQTNKQTNK